MNTRGRGLLRIGVGFVYQPPGLFGILERHEDPNAFRQLPLRLQATRVVRGGPGRDPVGLEHADDQPRLGRRRRPRDFLGETGHSTSMGHAPHVGQWDPVGLSCAGAGPYC